ncbi:hypothetical protein VTL71DRAFT_3033 [Oculimacula yallundae]|uniref:Uncharacterized protein n=1 Tax=Oculimacula yallundae TaxID=86028 RepID=A0ABR4C878_9HELO
MNLEDFQIYLDDMLVWVEQAPNLSIDRYFREVEYAEQAMRASFPDYPEEEIRPKILEAVFSVFWVGERPWDTDHRKWKEANAPDHGDVLDHDMEQPQPAIAGDASNQVNTEQPQSATLQEDPRDARRRIEQLLYEDRLREDLERETQNDPSILFEPSDSQGRTRRFKTKLAQYQRLLLVQDTTWDEPSVEVPVIEWTPSPRVDDREAFFFHTLVDYDALPRPLRDLAEERKTRTLLHARAEDNEDVELFIRWTHPGFFLTLDDMESRKSDTNALTPRNITTRESLMRRWPAAFGTEQIHGSGPWGEYECPPPSSLTVDDLLRVPQLKGKEREHSFDSQYGYDGSVEPQEDSSRGKKRPASEDGQHESKPVDQSSGAQVLEDLIYGFNYEELQMWELGMSVEDILDLRETESRT